MLRMFLVTLGSFLTLLGAVLMVTPLPGSSIMRALGVAILICSSERAAKCLLFFQARSRVLDKVLTWLEDRAGDTIGGALRRSRPSIPAEADEQ